MMMILLVSCSSGSESILEYSLALRSAQTTSQVLDHSERACACASLECAEAAAASAQEQASKIVAEKIVGDAKIAKDEARRARVCAFDLQILRDRAACRQVTELFASDGYRGVAKLAKVAAARCLSATAFAMGNRPFHQCAEGARASGDATKCLEALEKADKSTDTDLKRTAMIRSVVDEACACRTSECPSALSPEVARTLAQAIDDGELRLEAGLTASNVRSCLFALLKREAHVACEQLAELYRANPEEKDVASIALKRCDFAYSKAKSAEGFLRCANLAKSVKDAHSCISILDGTTTAEELAVHLRATD